VSLSPTRPREVGRGEQVVPGVWRLRLPLPWPGVPHCNAWALAAGDGVVLVDTGMHEPGSLGHLEEALRQVNLRLEHVRLIVCTHAHADHCGQAPPIAERTGCEVWLHPDHAHFTAQAADPEASFARRMEVARQSGVPEEPLRRWAEQRRSQSLGLAGELRAARDLVAGERVRSDLGEWDVIETPGHAPSHVVLHQPEHRLLLSGDHVLGRPSLYFDYGWTPDPVGEYIASLDAVEALDVRLVLGGHGRPINDLRGHAEAARRAAEDNLDAVRERVARDAVTAYDVSRDVYGELFMPATAGWLMTMTLCYLRHLGVAGEASRTGSDPERWTASF
jgi:glyoxylase-like metal-dependent hydrolase (beta-lactamase superfamily II)